MTDDDEDRSQETENRKRQRFAKKVHQDRHQDGGYDGARETMRVMATMTTQTAKTMSVSQGARNKMMPSR